MAKRKRKDTSLIFKYIYKRFLFIYFAILLGYTSINSVLKSQVNLPSEYEFLVDVIVPSVIALLVVIIFLRKRLGMLVLEPSVGNRGEYIRSNIFFAGFVIALSVLFLQCYVSSTFTELNRLSSVNELGDQFTNGDYLTIEEYEIRLDSVEEGLSARRDSESDNFEIVTCSFWVPIVPAKSNFSTDYIYWIHKEFHRTIDFSSNMGIQGSRRQKVLKQFRAKFKTLCTSEIKHFKLERDLRSASENNYPFVLKPSNREFDNYSKDYLFAFLFATIIGIGIWTFMLFEARFEEKDLKNFLKARSNK